MNKYFKKKNTIFNYFDATNLNFEEISKTQPSINAFLSRMTLQFRTIQYYFTIRKQLVLVQIKK
jgi:hypothetical protein